MTAYWFDLIWPEKEGGGLESDDEIWEMELKLETFGPLAQLDFQERFPDPVPLKAEDRDAAKAEAARLWPWMRACRSAQCRTPMS